MPAATCGVRVQFSELKRVRWTVSDYFRIADAGLLDNRRVELIEGDVVECAAQDNVHMSAVSRIARLLLGDFTDADWAIIRGTLIIPRHDAPDPDFHVFDVPIGTPDEQLPTPILVIEVSDITYLKDSGPKLRTYARAGRARLLDCEPAAGPGGSLPSAAQPDGQAKRLAIC